MVWRLGQLPSMPSSPGERLVEDHALGRVEAEEPVHKGVGPAPLREEQGGAALHGLHPLAQEIKQGGFVRDDGLFQAQVLHGPEHGGQPPP